MMKTHILTLLFTLAGLVGMAQTNQPLPSGAVPFGATTYLSPLDSTIWLYKERDGTAVNLGSWHKVDSLLALKADASDLADFYTQSQIDAFLALKADVSSLAGYVPTSRTINGKALTGNITLQMADIPNLVSTLANKADLSDLTGVIRSGDNNSELNNDAGYVTAATAPVTSVNGKTGGVVIDKGDLMLGNVDNTSDANKPISTATASALADRELLANKRTSLTSPNNTTYPTTRAVQDAIDAIEPPEVTGSNGIQVSGGVVSPVYGTTAGTVAQGNDSRINNGQTAFGWGDYRDYGLGVSAPQSVQDPPSWDALPSQFMRSTSAPNSPFGGVGAAINLSYSGMQKAQMFFSTNTGAATFMFRQTEGNSVWSPVRTVWHDGNFTPSNYIQTSQKGAANGVASLDGSGKVPTSQLPTTGMQYQGTWNANTNSPSLSDGTGAEGYFYRVTTAGTQNLGSGNITFSVGDDAIHNGSVWQRAPSGTTATNLALGSRTSTTIPITNSNGSGFTLPVATTTFAGLMSSADKTKMNAALTFETDPTVPNEVKAITGGDISSWNTAYGWGNHAGLYLPNNGSYTGQSMDDIPLGSYYAGLSTTLTDKPFFGVGAILSLAHNGGQLVFSRNVGGDAGRIAFRSSLSSGDYSPWVELWTSGNFNPSNYLTTANFTWSNLGEKPSTFTPSAHTHSGADIVSGTVPFARLPTGTSGSTVAIGNHTHTLAGDVTGGIGSTVIANSAVTFGKMQNIGTNTIVGRIAAGTGDATALSASQVRTIINVANGATANSSDATLLNRANHTGTQAIATVTGLQSALDGKMSIDYTESDPTVPSYVKSITSTEKSNWNTAYGWGNHASSGYAVSGTSGSQVRNNSQLDNRYLQGNQTVTLSGAVLGSGSTSISTTIANNAITTANVANGAITNAKLGIMSENSIKGRTAGSGAPLDLSPATIRNMLNVENGAQVNVPTNLAQGTRTATVVFVNSSTGTNAALASATTSLAGVMSAVDKTKLDGIAPSATANATNAQLRDRSTHTGTQAISTVSGLQNALDDAAGLAYVAEWIQTTVSAPSLDNGSSWSTSITMNGVAPGDVIVFSNVSWPAHYLITARVVVSNTLDLDIFNAGPNSGAINSVVKALAIRTR